MSSNVGERRAPFVTNDPAVAKASMLESLDRLRAEIENDEISIFLCCGNRHDGDFYVCAHVPPGASFQTIIRSIEHLMSQGIMPSFDREQLRQLAGLSGNGEEGLPQ